MQISTRPLNNGETYCCQTGIVKEYFSQFDISIHFGSFSENFRFDITVAKKPKIKGKVICNLSINSRDLKTSYPRSRQPILSFYMLKNEEYSEELKKEFVDKVLPQVIEWFKDCVGGKNYGIYRLFIELTEQKFKIHTQYAA